MPLLFLSDGSLLGPDMLAVFGVFIVFVVGVLVSVRLMTRRGTTGSTKPPNDRKA